MTLLMKVVARPNASNDALNQMVNSMCDVVRYFLVTLLVVDKFLMLPIYLHDIIYLATMELK